MLRKVLENGHSALVSKARATAMGTAMMVRHYHCKGRLCSAFAPEAHTDFPRHYEVRPPLQAVGLHNCNHLRYGCLSSNASVGRSDKSRMPYRQRAAASSVRFARIVVDVRPVCIRGQRLRGSSVSILAEGNE